MVLDAVELSVVWLDDVELDIDLLLVEVGCCGARCCQSGSSWVLSCWTGGSWA